VKINKYLILGLAGLSIAIFLLAARWYRNQETEKLQALTLSKKDLLIRSYSPSQGPEAAPVTIVEFFDPECESCRNMHPIVNRVLNEFGSKVRLVVRYMPFHRNSVYAASILESARKQGKYWEALDIVFEKQPEWGSHEAPKPELLIGYLSTLNLDLNLLKASLEDPEIKGRIQQDQADGRELGVKSTPSFFVNEKLITDFSYDGLRAAIQSNL